MTISEIGKIIRQETPGKKRHRAHGRPGFTLMEVLVAFAIMLTGLTLIAGIFGRHLKVLQLLRNSLTASDAADELLIQEAIGRERGPVISADKPQEGFTPQTLQNPLQFDKDPVKGLLIDEVSAGVSWSVRQQNRLTQIKAGFQTKSGS